MALKEMDPDEVRQLLESHVDVIHPEMEEVDRYFEKLQCIYCGGSCHRIVDASKLFDEGSVLPKFLAECNDCEAQFEPYLGIELRGPQRDPTEDDYNRTK